MFVEYIDWVRVLFQGLNRPDTELGHTLTIMRKAVGEIFDGDMKSETLAYIDEAMARLADPVAAPASYMDEGFPLADLARNYLDALLDGERHAASRLVLEAAESGVDTKDIYLHVFQKTPYELGRLWQTNRISVAQEHFCTAATQMVMSQLYPFHNRKRRTRNRRRRPQRRHCDRQPGLFENDGVRKDGSGRIQAPLSSRRSWRTPRNRFQARHPPSSTSRSRGT